MDSAPGPAPQPVGALAALAREPAAFEFFAAMRALECAAPEQPRLGQSARVRDDPVRLRHEPTLAFAETMLTAFQAGAPHTLTGQFLGLFGPNGPLPLHLTEHARDRLRNAHDPTFARFADIFHHRILCLFYRAWANAQPSVSLDRPQADRFALYVGAVAGIGLPALQGRDAWPDRARRFFGGRLAAVARNPEGLASLVRDYLGVPATVIEWVGHWMELPAESHTRLGAERDARLGVTATLGARVWGGQSKFRLRLGPLALQEFERLLPDGASSPALVALVRSYAGDEHAWDLQLVLRRADVRGMALGAGARLGWTSWLAPRAQADADDVVLTPLRRAA